MRVLSTFALLLGAYSLSGCGSSYVAAPNLDELPALDANAARLDIGCETGMTLNGKPIEDQDVSAALDDLKIDAGEQIVISAEGCVIAGRVMAAMDAVKKAGLTARLMVVEE